MNVTDACISNSINVSQLKMTVYLRKYSLVIIISFIIILQEEGILFSLLITEYQERR